MLLSNTTSLHLAQFTVSPGPPWWAAIPRGLWPEELLIEIQKDLQLAEGDPTKEKIWEEGRGDRRTELVCIGHELDKQAASAALEARCIASLSNWLVSPRLASPPPPPLTPLPRLRLLLHSLAQACLLTAEEMAAGEASWLALADPYAKAWTEAMGGHGGGGGNGAHVHGPGGHDKHGGGDGHTHGEGQGVEAERLADVERQLTDDLLSSKTLTLASLRKIMAIVGEQGVPPDDTFGFIFDALLDENAAKQINECAPALKELYAASADKRCTQRAILRGVVTLVGRLVDSNEAPLKKAQEQAKLKKTPSILMALYDNGLVEEQVVLKWHAQAPADLSDLPERDHVGRRVRAAAAPFIKWLKEADEETSSAEEADEQGAPDEAAQKEKEKAAAKRAKQEAKEKAAEMEAAMEAAWATKEAAPPEVQ